MRDEEKEKWKFLAENSKHYYFYRHFFSVGLSESDFFGVVSTGGSFGKEEIFLLFRCNFVSVEHSYNMID